LNSIYVTTLELQNFETSEEVTSIIIREELESWDAFYSSKSGSILRIIKQGFNISIPRKTTQVIVAPASRDRLEPDGTRIYVFDQPVRISIITKCSVGEHTKVTSCTTHDWSAGTVAFLKIPTIATDFNVQPTKKIRISCTTNLPEGEPFGFVFLYDSN